jgi:hypothetical protein
MNPALPQTPEEKALVAILLYVVINVLEGGHINNNFHMT